MAEPSPPVDDPIDAALSPLAAAAVGLHESYESLRAAGFSRMDALTVIALVIAHSNQAVNRDDSDGG